MSDVYRDVGLKNNVETWEYCSVRARDAIHRRLYKNTINLNSSTACDRG
ncbi:hypothetical protein COO91_04166 [Nostoc flagelliforme CCNUN1]|uniref:Uncharacterized protein n=1 Tax=Nostoc flagelliforme CCNUN1 TaxID=2038116 RepID=A0A2K8SS13_9NOSO|nr:hypothetical protein COO91_04166 [Nostoc flagelliforme CCNUN1]